MVSFCELVYVCLTIRGIERVSATRYQRPVFAIMSLPHHCFKKKTFSSHIQLFVTLASESKFFKRGLKFQRGFVHQIELVYEEKT